MRHHQDLASVRCRAVLACWQRQLFTAFPVSRFSATVHHCQNQNVVLLNCIENSIGKFARHTPPNILIYHNITSRRFFNPVDCILNSINECLCHLNPLFCIVLNRFSIFCQSFRVKDIPHYSSNRLT